MGSFLQKVSENKALSISLFVLFLYLVPFLALGQAMPVLVHDNVDQVFVWYKVLAESGTIIAPLDQTIPNFMGGLPRNVLVGASEFNLIVWLYTIFDPFAVYLLNIFIIHIVAFAGMFLLLKGHFLRKPEQKWLVSGIALCFALLPFWPLGQLSIAGQPLALWAFLNIRNRTAKKRHWLPILLIPFYASFVYGFLFFLVGIGLLWLYDLLKKHRLNLPFLAALIFMGILFVIAEYRLFFNMFFDAAFQSHRLEFSGYPGDTVKIILRGGRTFLFGGYHAASLHLPFLFAAAIIAAIVAFFRKGGKSVSKFVLSTGSKSLFVKLFLLLILISLFDEAVTGWNLLLPLKESFPFLRTFTLGRFKFLFPLIWFLLFALSLKFISKRASYGKHIALAFIILQAGLLFSVTGNEFQSGGIGLFLSGQPSFREFHSVSLFGEIDAFIGQPKSSYRVVSLGIHPSIAQFNGFYTLDSYQNNYPLEYKRRFRLVIEKELEKSSNLQQYFDKWGSRCYVFSAELEGNAMQAKDKNGKVENLELNTQALKELGADYIFSAVEIANAEDNSLTLLHTFERQDSIWRIWLYRIE
jgi:hypothetical protein